MKTRIILSTILLLISSHISALTWDEPWREEVLQKAEYLVLGKVIMASDSLITLQIQKDFGGILEGEIKIDNFFMLDICSSSGGHGPRFRFAENDQGYFFLKKGENGNYQLPTPTSGVDRVVKDKIHAVYRHSYHQAALTPEIYELTYTAIWNYYQEKSYDEKEITTFIQHILEKDPAGFEPDEIEIFFQQHAALESAYLMKIDVSYQVLKKFIESGNFHLQVSGIRAMGILTSEQAKNYLLQYIEHSSPDDFNTVIAIWTLWKFGNAKDKRRIWKLRNTVSKEDSGFGGDIMDPRVCTYFPSPKGAIFALRNKKKKERKRKK